MTGNNRNETGVARSRARFGVANVRSLRAPLALKIWASIALTLAVLSWPLWAQADQIAASTVQTAAISPKSEPQTARDNFISSAFDSAAPRSKTVWLKGDVRTEINRILGHSKYPGLRVRYWRDDARTVWILEEIGKYKPITTGIVVQDGAIESVKVLVYRESHGWEVKHDFFTRQFVGAHLTSRQKLSENIDGISGATLSVRALKNLARMALFLDDTVRRDG